MQHKKSEGVDRPEPDDPPRTPETPPDEPPPTPVEDPPPPDKKGPYFTGGPGERPFAGMRGAGGPNSLSG